LDKSVGPTLIVTTKAAPEASRTAWTAAGVEVFELEETNSKQQCISILEELGRRGILQVMVEGGASVQSNLLSYGLVDKLVVYQGSCILGNTGRSWSQVPLAETIAKAGFWKLQSVAQFDNDIRSVYEQ
jgi:diaminohydroxyphosphoribosylaminopyrimidine deaminase/5-amino-6-(5-phosphoribosylamino)uracil reductase